MCLGWRTCRAGDGESQSFAAEFCAKVSISQAAARSSIAEA